MDAKELRIGNLVKYNFRGVHTIDSATELSDIELKYVGVEPIPLDEEWLIKLGYKKQENTLLFDDAVLYINNGVHIYLEGGHYEYGYDTRVKIRWIHQLQNLYYALTSEELTIK